VGGDPEREVTDIERKKKKSFIHHGTGVLFGGLAITLAIPEPVFRGISVIINNFTVAPHQPKGFFLS
jgi:hypothetical protein